MRRVLALSVVGLSLFGTAAWGDGTGVGKPGAAATQPQSGDLLTAQEIRKLVEAGQYRSGLQALVRVLDLKGAAAADYDTHEMLMLKAECLLQIKEPKAAVDTLGIAAKNALKESNEEHGAQANGLMELIQKSPTNFYLPRYAAIKKPLPILDREQRKAAYEALFNDEFADFQKLVKVAMGTMLLQPTLDAAKAAVGMRAVERMATGNNKQSEEQVSELAKHSIKMINVALDDLTMQSRRISEAANRTITTYVNQTDQFGHSYQQPVTRKQGLTADDKTVLKNIMDTCTRIPPVMQEMAKWLGTEQDGFNVAALKSNNVKADANHTLNADYQGM